MWLRDLLPHALPSARIMVFNHDSAWRFDAPVKSVKDCGNQLLDAVRTCRRSDEVGLSISSDGSGNMYTLNADGLCRRIRGE